MSEAEAARRADAGQRLRSVLTETLSMNLQLVMFRLPELYMAGPWEEGRVSRRGARGAAARFRTYKLQTRQRATQRPRGSVSEGKWARRTLGRLDMDLRAAGPTTTRNARPRGNVSEGESAAGGSIRTYILQARR